MSKASFWNKWARPYKNLFLMLLALLAGSIIYFVAVMWLGAGLVIDWQTITKLEEVRLPLDQWQHPLLNFGLEANSYVVRQNFLGSELQVNLWPAHLLLIMMSIGLSISLAVISSLRRFWYMLGIGLFCVLVVSLQMEQIQLFGRIDKTADMLVFLLFLPLSYYFQSIRPSLGLPVRIASFLALFALMAFLIHAFAGVAVPFLYIANYGLPAFMVLSFLLILLVSAEIIAGILYLITAFNSEHSRNSLTHFLLASFIYLANLLLYYFQVRGVLELDIYLISPFWILLVSLIVAFWTLRARNQTFGQVIPYEPFGALLYVALAIICLNTISYVFATANDPLIETFEDAILYSHLGMGGLFFLYIIANFIGLLKENKRVYAVLYKPRNMPLFTARLTGLIAVLGFFSLHGMYAIYQPMGGYYNSIGDLYTADEDYYVAEQYYKLGSEHKYANHRSNYALASLARRVNKPVPAMMYLKESLERHPTPYAYANLAHLYFTNNLYFDGLFTLKEGIDRFPQEGRLYNNLGVQFGKTQVLDSALYYLQAARQNASRQSRELEEVTEANELAILSQGRLLIPADSLDAHFREGNLFYQNNLLAYYNIIGASEKAPEKANPAVFQELGGLEAAWLLNFALLKKDPDSTLLLKVQQLIDSATVSYYEEPAGLALGVLLYKQQNHFEAFRKLEDLAARSQFNSPLYYKLLGGWALEHESPAMAVRYFGQAVAQRDAEAGLLQAVALAEAGQPLEAAEVLIQTPDSLLGQAGQSARREMLYLLDRQDFSEFQGKANETIYKALRLQWGKLDSSEEEMLLSQIQDRDWRMQALIWLSKAHLQKGSLQQAEAYIQRLEEQLARSPEPALEEAVSLLRHRLARYTGENEIVPLHQSIYPGALGDLYARASQAAATGDTIQALEHYRKIMQATPFLEEAYFAAIPLLNELNQEQEAYDFLLRAIYFNPKEVPLRELYILQSLRLGLEQYAMDELEGLRQLVDRERFEEFLERYQELQKRLEEAGVSW